MSTTLEVDDLVGWGIYEVARLQDPYPTWARIRTETPALSTGDGVFFVTSWELVDRVVRDAELLAGRGVAESMTPPAEGTIDVASLWLMSLDGPKHLRARGLVRRSFSARQVEGLRSFVTETANALVESFLSRCSASPVDFIEHVALALPSEVIRHLFRIDKALWAEKVHAHFLPGSASSATLIGDLTRVFQEVEAPTGLFHDLRQTDEDGNCLTHDEMIANAVLLTMAAIDTTTGLIANTILCLLKHPDVLSQVCADPALAADAVEETLRFEPPALSCSRFAPKAIELGGVSVPAESHLLLGIGAANRDPRKYEEPDEFRLGRDLSGLLTFGGGRHFCLGATLARMEAQVVLEALLPHLPALELQSPATWRTDNPTVRIPEALNLVRKNGGSQ